MKVGIALLVVLVGLIAFIATRPTHYRVARKIAIAAPVGDVFEHVGSLQVGQGKMKITESVPGQRVRLELVLTAPFESTAQVELAFSPQPSSTEVTWSMEGDRNFMAKVFGMFVDMDGMIGKDVEAGLGQLRVVAEAAAQKRYADQLAAAHAAAARAAAVQPAAAQDAAAQPAEPTPAAP